MSATHCPVCNEPKEKRWHLVCPYCWVKVPDADQEEIYALYKKGRGSEAHREKCFSVLRRLITARRAATRDQAAAVAKSEGAAAFHEGQSETANPYAHGTDEHLSWNDGFIAAGQVDDAGQL